jgi:hypothetical protein
MDSLPDLSGDNVRIAARKLYYRNNLSEFFKRELKIRTKAMGLQAFHPNAVQIPIIAGAEKQLREQGKIRQIIFKCRQPGTSTYSSGVIANRVFLYPGVYAFVVAQDKTTVGNIFAMHDIFYRNMSQEIRPLRQYFTKGTEIVLGNPDPNDMNDPGMTSKLLVGESKNINLGVGQTIHALHLSEVCRYPSADSIKESLLPACSDYPGTVRILESTAHFGGGAEYFRDQCDRAIAGKSEYQYHFVEWWKLPEYTIPLDKGEKLRLDGEERYLVKKIGISLENVKWRRSKIADFQGDVDMFRLSYPMNFSEGWITKEASTFPWDRLMEMRSQLKQPAKRFKIVEGRLFADPEGEFWVWKMPEKDKLYDIGGDAAEGHEDGDWSVGEVIERTSNEQVAEYRAHLLPREFGDVLAAIGRFYNNGQVIPEINHPGNSTLERLKDIYTNIYIWRKRDQISTQFTKKFGWQTTYESKSVMVNLAREKLYYRQVTIHSELLWNELKNYVRDFTPTGMITYRAATGFDDAAMAWMISLIGSDDENYDKYNSISVRDAKEEKPKQEFDPAFHDSTWDGIFQDSEMIDSGGWK